MKSSWSNCVIVALVFVSLVALSKGTEVHYVSEASASPLAPFLTWATAATNIQDALDVAADGDTVLVTNGVYGTGGRVVYGTMTNRVVVDKAVVVRSVNGPEVTVIQGYKAPGGYRGVGDGAIRCVYLANGAVLSGFTLTNGATRASGDLSNEGSGGAVWCQSTNAVVTNCALRGNSAHQGGGAYGGTLNKCALTDNSTSYFGNGAGAYDCTLSNCTLTDNSAWDCGGGACNCLLSDCTLTDNNADYGGGACGGTLNNSTLRSNSAGYYGGGASDGTLINCTLVDNWGFEHGGGASDGTLINCTLTGNSAGYYGGGSADCMLTNCMLTDNSAGNDGGGAGGCTLHSCTLTGNSAFGSHFGGGGASFCALTNCIVYYNTATGRGPNYYESTLDYCCTTPLPDTGTGNITNEPAFVDLAAGNYRLQCYSACVDAGTNQGWMAGAVDLDGNPRISGNVVDIGAYEYQCGGLMVQAVEQLMAQVESKWRRSRPLLATLSAALRSMERCNSVAAVNQLGAFRNKVRAQVARSDPALATSFIQAAQDIIDVLSRGSARPGNRPHGQPTSVAHHSDGRVRVRWSAAPDRTYRVEVSTNLVDWEGIGAAVEQGEGSFTFEDANAARFPNRFYRLRPFDPGVNSLRDRVGSSRHR